MGIAERARHPRVIFVCVENANRSQMAEGFARDIAGAWVHVMSAGTRPAERVNPRALWAMAEIGIDLSPHRPTALHGADGRPFDMIVTMGCGDRCESVSAHSRQDWQIPDPRDLPDPAFRAIRDLIGRKVESLIRQIAPATRASARCGLASDRRTWS